MNIKPTAVERLILANQYRILAKLEHEEAFERKAEALMEGHAFFYGNVPELYDELSETDTRYVLDVLQLFASLSTSYRQLSDKSGIKPSDVEFYGFDGNNEVDFLGFAQALKKNGRYTETLSGKLNSHMPTTEMYERMLGGWRKEGSPTAMTRQQILAVIAERTHPDNRDKA